MSILQSRFFINRERRCRMSDLETLASNNDRCGESPIWDADKGRLIWNDMNASLVFALDHATGTAQKLNTNGLNAAGIALNATGELVFAGTGGLHLWRDDSEAHNL